MNVLIFIYETNNGFLKFKYYVESFNAEIQILKNRYFFQNSSMKKFELKQSKL